MVWEQCDKQSGNDAYQIVFRKPKKGWNPLGEKGMDAIII